MGEIIYSCDEGVPWEQIAHTEHEVDCISNFRERERERERMGTDEATPSATGLYGGGGDRGAGGKFKKSSARGPRSTPYDRPPPNQLRRGGWISKLVGGATRILPSVFSRLPSYVAENPEYNVPEEENADEENIGCPSELEELESAEEAKPTEGVETLNNSNDADQLGQDKISSLSGGTDFSKIEQLLKELQFSRDDANRLVELLHSKVTEASNVEPVGKKPTDSNQREGKGPVLPHETPRLCFKEEQESLNVAGLRTPMPLFQSNLEEVGASPIDIAKAYMGNRGSEVSTDYGGRSSKYGRHLVRSDRYASLSLVPSPSPETSVCWPGAMAEDRFGHSTPQSVSSRYGLHQFQRSPYSRSIYSKSKSKLARPEADSNRFQNFPSSRRLQPQTPFFGQSERIHNEIGGSVGPVRRLRRKFLSEASPRGSTSYHSSQHGHSPTAITNSFLHSTENLASAASKATRESQFVSPSSNGSEAGCPALQTSNPAVRAILEHLDRHVPTPKEKLAELQLATASNKSSFPKLTDKVLKQGNDRAMTNTDERPQQRSEATEVDKDAKTNTIVNGSNDDQRKPFNEAFSFGLSNIRAINTDNQSTSHIQNEGKSVVNAPLRFNIPESLKRPPNLPSGTKPSVASLSVDKPHLRSTFLSDSNSSGFTFSLPISSPSVALPEPPTPSVMPSGTAGGPPQPKNDGLEVPKYSFGEKRSTPRLNFSFPSTSNFPAQDEVSDLKFSFGEGKKSRLSFKSVGKDAICY